MVDDIVVEARLGNVEAPRVDAFRWFVSSLCAPTSSPVLSSQSTNLHAHPVVLAWEHSMTDSVVWSFDFVRTSTSFSRSKLRCCSDERVHQRRVELAGVLNAEVHTFDPQRLAGHDLTNLGNISE